MICGSSAGAQQVNDGAQSLKDGVQTLNDGTQTLAEGAQTLTATDRFGNTYTETMKRPKTFSTDLNE